MTEFLLLVASNHRSRKSTVSVPTARLGSRVSSRHPSQKFAIIDDKVGKGKLVRVEEERRDTKREDREPEVDEVWYPDGKRGVEEQEEIPHSHVDARPRETRVQDTE